MAAPVAITNYLARQLALPLVLFGEPPGRLATETEQLQRIRAYLGWSVSGRLSARVPIVVVAHRGDSRRAPENTLSAFKAAIDDGADFAELDVQETSDGAIVVLVGIGLIAVG